MSDDTFRIGNHLVRQDWWDAAMVAGQKNLDELDATLEWELDDPRFDSLTTASGLEFCGCDVCCLREMMYFLFARIMEGIAEGNIIRVD